MYVYFICVLVHVQMWYVCTQPYVDQTKKIFVLFVCFWKWFVSPMFFKVVQVFFVWKTCLLAVFVTYFMCKFSHKLKGPILKFFSLDREFCDCFAIVSQVKLTNENTSEISREVYQRNYQRKFPYQHLKGISWDICFKLLPSSPKPLF